MSEQKLDLSFLQDLKTPATDDMTKQLQIEALMAMGDELIEMSAKFNENINKNLNEKLATGNCFVRDDILFIREDGEEKAIWFPKGNALEYQRDNGLISQETAKTMIDATDKLQKLVDEEEQRKDGGEPA